MSNVTNAPTSWKNRVQESMVKAVEIYLVPEWIALPFTRKYNLVDIHDYGKLRTVASLEDIAQMEVLTSCLFKNAGSPAVSFSDPAEFSSVVGRYHSDKKGLTPEQCTEYDVTVQALMKQPDIVKNALNRLRGLSTDHPDSDFACSDLLPVMSRDAPSEGLAKSYRVILINAALYIMVEEGFLGYLKEKANRLAFLTDVLKSAYAVSPIRVVNSSPWYKQYVEALSA